MDRLNMEYNNIIESNVDYIGQRFPNCIKEIKDENGIIKKKIDLDALKNELGIELVPDKSERFQMNWPEKKKTINMADMKCNKTLRPNIQESLNFYDTKNIYIEGDNLDALKVLRETYLEKIKLIYVDPPYNAGKDLRIFIDRYLEFVLDLLKYCLFKDMNIVTIPLSLESRCKGYSNIPNVIEYSNNLVREILKIKNALKYDTTPKLTVEAMLIEVTTKELLNNTSN